jgi:hypothetical protein
MIPAMTNHAAGIFIALILAVGARWVINGEAEAGS